MITVPGLATTLNFKHHQTHLGGRRTEELEVGRNVSDTSHPAPLQLRRDAEDTRVYRNAGSHMPRTGWPPVTHMAPPGT